MRAETRWQVVASWRQAVTTPGPDGHRRPVRRADGIVPTSLWSAPLVTVTDLGEARSIADRTLRLIDSHPERSDGEVSVIEVAVDVSDRGEVVSSRPGHVAYQARTPEPAEGAAS